MAQPDEPIEAQLLGASPVIAALRRQVQQLLRQSATHRLPPILIRGETGAGKGLLARLIHSAGPRRQGPFVDVNCAAIPETLLEAELFGYERGAFTEARQSKPGLFQTAHRGTIFLDEVGLLPETLQAKLLKVVEERVVRRLGSTRGEPVDVSILAATNEDLVDAVRARRFREDLYHRLAVLTIELPPLRERRDDIILLAGHFLARTCSEYGMTPKALAADAKAALREHAWPGNVRELANVIERASLLGEGAILTASMLRLDEGISARSPVTAGTHRGGSVKTTVAGVEERLIRQTLVETNWNISRTASRLGISRNTLRARLKKYQLQPESSPSVSSAPPLEAPAAQASQPAPPPADAVVSLEPRRLAVLRVVLPRESGRAMELLIEKVEAFGGRVIEIAATGLTAAFGLDPVEDAPRRAALAALAMQKAATREERDGVEVSLINAAIHIVQVRTARVGGVTDIDDDTKRHVGSVLDALIRAAEAGAIVVSRSARSLLARRFDALEMPISEPAGERIYRLTEYRPTSFEVGGHMGRFVGREHELGFLRDRFAIARQGQGQVVALVGDAGIGKSRLLFEFRQSLVEPPVTFAEGHCFSYGSSIPYLPMLEVTRTIAGLAESDTPEETADKIRTCLESVGMAPAETGPYLLHLLGIKDGADPVAALAPEVIRARTHEALHSLVLRVSEREPLILAVEDLHWIDRASEDYLASLVERLARARILLVVTYRPGYRPRWAEKSIASQMALQPLAPQESLSVVRVVFGAQDVTEAVAELILAKAEGNPFFLEELARAAREHGIASAAALTVPDTVQEVLLARIDRLPADERRLLQSAAVIGKDFTFEILQAITGVPDEDARRGLHNLRAAEFVDETNLLPQPEYTFKHALTHEVAYGSISHERRRAIHTAIVTAIENLYRHRLLEQTERLARHALNAELWDKAFAYCSQAGARAVGGSAHAEAAESFLNAILALRHLPQTPDRLRQAIDVRFDLRNSLHALGQFEQIMRYLEEAKTIAESLSDPDRLGRVSAYMVQYLWWAGDTGPALRSAERALAIAAEFNNPSLRVITNFYLGVVHHLAGEYERAIEVLTDILETLSDTVTFHGFGPGRPAVFTPVWLLQCHAEMGNFPAAMAHGADARRITEDNDHPFSSIQVNFGFGFLYLRTGEIDRACRHLERAMELCERWNVPIWFPRVASALGYAYALAGRDAEALPLLKRAVERAESQQIVLGRSLAVLWLAEAHLKAERVDEAAATTERALAMTRSQRERGHEAWALKLEGDVALFRWGASSHESSRTEAERWYREALTLASTLAMRPLVARTHFALGRLQLRTDVASAKEHLVTARAMFQDMGMPALEADVALALTAV